MNRVESSEKAALRAAVRARRADRAADPARAGAAQDALLARVRARVSALSPAVVVAYASLPGEPSLDPLLDELIRADVPLLLPVTRKGEPLLLGRASTPVASLPRGTWDIREPHDAHPAAEALARFPNDPASADILVLTPGLSFDACGARLGNGGGFYDRTFGPRGVLADTEHAPLRARLTCVGVCWDDEVEPRLPLEPWDLAVTEILTEARTLRVDEAGAEAVPR